MERLVLSAKIGQKSPFYGRWKVNRHLVKHITAHIDRHFKMASLHFEMMLAGIFGNNFKRTHQWIQKWFELGDRKC